MCIFTIALSCRFQIDASELEDQNLSESPDLEQSTPPPLSAGTPPLRTPSTSRVASPHEDSPASSPGSRKTLEESSTKQVKRKRRSENDIELQKLVVLKQMASKVEADSTPDVFTTFGNQVASELRLIQEPEILTRLKRNIMNMIYDAQDNERSRSSSSPAPPEVFTFQPINPPHPSL